MPENKRRNPFEDHINSESFDVSKLGSVKQHSPMQKEMDEFFANLPDELTYELWDTEFDERQQAISAHLATRLAEQILRENHGEMLEDFSDAELIELLTVPVTLSMLAEQRLHITKQEKQEIIAPPVSTTYRDDFSELPPNIGDILNEWFLKARDFLISLFRRS